MGRSQRQRWPRNPHKAALGREGHSFQVAVMLRFRGKDFIIPALVLGLFLMFMTRVADGQ